MGQLFFAQIVPIGKMKKLVEKLNIEHVAIIMDGNRRWAKRRFLPSAVGHTAGVKSLKNVVKACNAFGIKFLTVYAFSTENWNRKPEEVAFLMELLANTIKNELTELHENNVVLDFIGDLGALDSTLREILNNARTTTVKNTGVHLQIAINYGARDEITHAVRKIVAEGVKPEKITEELISKHLYTKDIPDPDILIRTGGEKRISNYLLWQIAYSEIFVVKTFWPDFGKNALADVIKEFAKRQRRFGA